MRIVIAPDSFKESMSAFEAATAMAHGVRDAAPDAVVNLLPVSDGGEGFARTVTAAWGGQWVEVDVEDALGRPITAGLGMHKTSAVVDLASAAGLERISATERDVMRSSTRGLGLLIRAALGRGATSILVGLGGSATNDMGLGMLQALGAVLADDHGDPVPPYPEAFDRITRIDARPARRALSGVELTAAHDVTNPLLGPHGATAVFGPQKGVRPGQVETLDAELGRLAALTDALARIDDPGAGAAGGAGFALAAVLGARVVPGVEAVSQAIGLEERIRGADLVLTGEGAVDAQSLDGKAVSGVIRAARRHEVPVVVFGGVLREGAEHLATPGVELVRVSPPGEDYAVALARGADNLRRAVFNALTGRVPDGPGV